MYVARDRETVTLGSSMSSIKMGVLRIGGGKLGGTNCVQT